MPGANQYNPTAAAKTARMLMPIASRVELALMAQSPSLKSAYPIKLRINAECQTSRSTRKIVNPYLRPRSRAV